MTFWIYTKLQYAIKSANLSQFDWSGSIIVDKDFSRNWMNRSDLPLVSWWQADDYKCLTLYLWDILLKSLVTNCFPLSVRTLIGHTCLEITNFKKPWNTSIASIVLWGWASTQLVSYLRKLIYIYTLLYFLKMDRQYP